MTKLDDIAKSWTASELRRWPAQCLRDVTIPEPSKSFLIEVGLPAYHDAGFYFYPLVSEPLRLADKPHLRSIGRLYEPGLICLDELADGRVILVDGYRDRYVNSRVERFAACLILYLQLRAIVQRTTPAEYDEQDARFERDLLNIDPTVFSDPENFWAIIASEMKQNLG